METTERIVQGVPIQRPLTVGPAVRGHGGEMMCWPGTLGVVAFGVLPSWLLLDDRQMDQVRGRPNHAG
jgi:hypothetical protein